MEPDKDATLYARVTWAEIKPGKIDDAVTSWKQVLTAEQKSTGFRDAYLLLDQSARSALAVSLWESRAQAEQMTAEVEGLNQMKDLLAIPSVMEADNVPVRTAEIKPAKYARVTSADIKGLAVVESGVIWEQALPEYERVPGFQGALMLQALHSARGLVVTFWESEDAARRTSESGMRTAVLSRFVEAMAGPPTVEGFEVLLQI